MEKITLEDIAKIQFASNIQLSPDHKHVSYVVTTPCLKENSYNKDIYYMNLDTGKYMQLTHDGKSSDAIYDDENTLLFSANRSKEDEAEAFTHKTVFYRLPLDAGEAYRAFEIPLNVMSIQKASKNLYVVKALVDWNEPDPKKESKEYCEEQKDYHIFEEVPFWGNGRGFISGKRSALYLFNELDGSLLRITEKYTNVSSYDVNENKIVYVSRTYEDLFPTTASLTLYDISSKKKKVIVKQGKEKIGEVVLNHNDVIFTATDMKKWGSGELEKIYRYDIENKTRSLIFENKEEVAIGDTPLCDTLQASGTSIKCVGHDIYLKVMIHYQNFIYKLDENNEFTKAFDFDGCIAGFDVDENHLVMIASSANETNAIYKVEDAKAITCHALNTELLKDKYIAQAEYIPFTNRAGQEIDGWILKPKGYSPKKKYPGLLEIHGGPRCAYGTSFFHEMQVLASNGYFVFFTNPRGSEGYGEEYADLRGKYGTIDFEDLMDFTDHVLKTYKQIDSKRIGCLGGSYGGFMCNWIEGNTDRFSAIASQRSVSNWVSDFGTSEIGVTFDSNEMGATPWSDMTKMWDQSPLKYACNAKTPILFIHSLCDYNCPINQGVEMFTAMKYFHVPSKMVVFEGENHSLSRSGKPKHRIRRLKEMKDWFDQYLG